LTKIVTDIFKCTEFSIYLAHRPRKCFTVHLSTVLLSQAKSLPGVTPAMSLPKGYPMSFFLAVFDREGIISNQLTTGADNLGGKVIDY
jgi:hypothetical protein